MYGNVIYKAGASDTPWRYASAWLDRFPSSNADSQAGLYKMGERYHDPELGRWTQKDPLDQTPSLREGNGYMYAGADPVNYLDPFGLHGQYSNGCGAAGSRFDPPDNPGGFRFHPACDGHDKCYARQDGKDYCDSGFLSTLQAVCRRETRQRRQPECRGIARRYYLGVRTIFGKWAYEAAGK